MMSTTNIRPGAGELPRIRPETGEMIRLRRLADHYREMIVEAVRHHHRFGENDNAVDALHVELNGLSLNTLEAIAKALEPDGR
jgi:hypothetical protein